MDEEKRLAKRGANTYLEGEDVMASGCESGAEMGTKVYDNQKED